MAKGPWENIKDEPLTPNELQRVRYDFERTSALWMLWGWLASMIKDIRAIGAFAATAGVLWGDDIVRAVSAYFGGGQ